MFPSCASVCILTVSKLYKLTAMQFGDPLALGPLIITLRFIYIMIRDLQSNRLGNFLKYEAN
jgi:hypothetical protein